jgi:radical SAM superfamily enzyme YgiQ (UPF0313 family)
MELPPRTNGDVLLQPGEMTDIRRRLRALTAGSDLTTVIACAFDHRTRMLPFIYADMRMVPAGVRAIGSAMVDAGFEKTRIVLQQWNKRFRPSRMQIDGRMPDMLLISAMQLHWAPCREMIRDANRIDPAHRPLIIVGGPKTIYEPWDVFGYDPADPWGADVAVTGEEYVLLALMEVLLTERGEGESMRAAFLRAHDSGALDNILGLVYARGDTEGVARELVDTGIQRLNADFDETPSPVLGYSLLEPPSRRAGLSSGPLPPEKVRRYSPLSSLVLTQGCKFRCQYCPIPAYNQRQYRAKSGERIVEDIRQLQQTYGIHNYFGADDNFFNDHQRAIAISEALMNATIDGVPLRKRARIGTEVTVHDAWALREHLPVVRKAGIRALWIGVEDLSGALVKKGQTPDTTTALFRRLRELGIAPMPMMMHHDDQPLISRGDGRGLLNQVHLLQKAGAATMQILMITPSPGSALYDSTYTSGMVYKSVGRQLIEPHLVDGNRVIASRTHKPWHNQFNLTAAYLLFYNPLRLLLKILDTNTRVKAAYIVLQVVGMWGLAKTIRRTFGYGLRLMWATITRHDHPPRSPIPMRSPDGSPAPHDLPAAPEPDDTYAPSPADVQAATPTE